MPTLSHLTDRHSTVDRRYAHYLSFPDLWRAPSDEVLCAYREADEHVPNRRRLLLSRSRDNGRTWSAPEELNPTQGHCPRFSEPEPGRLTLIDDAGRTLYHSADAGLTWRRQGYQGMRGFGVPDRILPLADGSWLTTGHRHQGEVNPATGQQPATQAVFRSTDRGAAWEQISVMGGDPDLVLCEASMARLPGGRILALLRENSQVFEPMYRVHSDDEGRSWSAPEPTGLIGHRPTLGLTRGGRLLVTYRDRGPAGGTAAWMGEVDDLTGFAVHSSLQHGPEPACTASGLVLDASDERPPFYALRPLTHPAEARAMLEARVRAEGDGGLLRLGLAWRVSETALTPILPSEGTEGENDAPRDLSIPLVPGQANDIRLDYDRGRLSVCVNGEQRAGLDLPANHIRRRAVLFGCAPDGQGTVRWERVRQFGVEPGAQNTYVWDWEPALGQPDARVRETVLELAADPGAAWCDYGYSGWVETGDGEFLCAYHHGGADAPGYEPGKSSHVRATRFSEGDFG